MKATLEFTLPDEAGAHQLAIDGADWRDAMADLDEELRKWMKYGHEFKDAHGALDGARVKLHECLRDHGLTLYE